MAAAARGPCPSLLDYRTAKLALTRNRRVGGLHRLLQLAVLGYLLGWVLLARKGYQDTDPAPRAALLAKLKGAAPLLASQGENGLFLVTNFIATAQQSQDSCPESPAVPDALCSEDADCPVGNSVPRGNGIKTGKCVMFNSSHSTCEIYGWCPRGDSPWLLCAIGVHWWLFSRKPLLAQAENLTLFIKNTVHFTKFNFSRCNALQTNDSTYFKTCTYDPSFSPFCPVFRVRDVLEAAGETFDDFALLGGSISIRIKWDCDLDRPAAQCQPQYSFSLQDRGYNFRTASYYWDSQRRLSRTLLKLHGIRFDISVYGQAGKFSIIPAAVSFGTGIAFFG
ncbi:P2RX6 protein, partial [Centropus unirufus]|nr:P2RX6 protein [Centropus unirufus]